MANVADSQDSDPIEPKLDPNDDPDKHITQFMASISSIQNSEPFETPNYLDEFLESIELKLKTYESDHSKFRDSIKNSPSFFITIDCLSDLIESVSKFRSASSSAVILINSGTSLLHRTMLLLGNELVLLLHKKEPPTTKNDDSLNPIKEQETEKQDSDSKEDDKDKDFPPFLSEDVTLMSSIVSSMKRGCYKKECDALFSKSRTHAFEEELNCQGHETNSIDDVQKMQWDSLESEITTWIHVIKRLTSFLFPGELRFYELVFPREISTVHFSNLTSAVVQPLLNLPYAVAMTKRSSEKLFKFLDMYEATRGLETWLDEVGTATEARSELATAGSSLGEAAVSIFCELENSIKNDNMKQPVAYGAVHPLTRYVMNYLKYACEYGHTLEELFVRHPAIKEDDRELVTTPFTAQLMKILDLLDSSVEARSRLYKDASLRFIFLMNNGRYMLQKIKGSQEMHQSLVDTWCRKRSSDVRSYHKNYQRDTWGRVLKCLTQEGLVVHGKVLKPVLKERFKSFNQQFDEIHKAQSMWVVSDEQLKSELRVSISAVMIPAYRAFVARFGPVFTPGRQYEKHIKYQAEDIETAIEELFEGN